MNLNSSLKELEERVIKMNDDRVRNNLTSFNYYILLLLSFKVISFFDFVIS